MEAFPFMRLTGQARGLQACWLILLCAVANALIFGIIAFGVTAGVLLASAVL